MHVDIKKIVQGLAAGSGLTLLLVTSIPQNSLGFSRSDAALVLCGSTLFLAFFLLVSYTLAWALNSIELALGTLLLPTLLLEAALIANHAWRGMILWGLTAPLALGTLCVYHRWCANRYQEKNPTEEAPELRDVFG